MDETPTRLRLSAPAKLNLSLRVVGKRRDGFHELESIMVLLELADELLLTTGDAELRVEPAGLPPATGPEIVLALAPFPLPTAAVFAELREADWGRAGPSGNDLLAPARRLRPELDELIRLAVAAGVEPRLTGSGPTLFAILDDPERADAVAGRLRRG